VVRRARPRPRRAETVPRLHAKVRRAISSNPSKLIVRYDPIGIPRVIYIDYQRLLADEEITYLVTGFRRLRPLTRRAG